MNDAVSPPNESSNNNNQALTMSNRPFTIESLPDEVLVRIIRALRWPDRLCIEGVSPHWQELARAHGWAHEQSYDERPTEQRYRWIRQRIPFLTRMGPNLRTLSIDQLARRNEGYGDRASTALALCPKLRHLSLYAEELDPALVSQLRNHPNSQSLKSLCLSFCFETTTSAESIIALSEALNDNAFPTLEYLKLTGDGGPWLDELRLFSHSLLNLRCFILDHYGYGVLAAQNLEVLAKLTSLRSLFLNCGIRDLSFLRQLPHLHFLSIPMFNNNCETFEMALPHLVGLRALDIQHTYFDQPGQVERLLLSLANHIPLLEHLGFDCDGAENKGFALLSSFQRLRSLELHPNNDKDDWAWLVNMSQLEYLQLGEEPPQPVMCDIIAKCTNLRAINLLSHGPFWPDPEPHAAMLKAGIPPAVEDEEEGQTAKGSTLPKLEVCFLEGHDSGASTPDSCHHGLGEDGADDVKGSRVHFVTAKVESHVRNLYKYGCLSEKPNFLGDMRDVLEFLDMH